MEISIEQRVTGRAMRDGILRRHGSRARVEAAAERGDLEAQDDLAMLRLLEERPRRLDEVFDVREVSRVTPRELARLSEVRLRLLELLGQDGKTVPEVARATGLSVGQVRRHLYALQELGMVQRQGRSRPARLSATVGLDIHITTGRAASGPGA